MPDVIHWQHEAAVVRTDDWLQLDDAAELPSLDGTQHYLLSLSRWLLLQRAQPSLLGTAVARARLGVWLTPDAAIDALQPWLHDIPMIAIHIPTLADGRGYSMARRLRTHYGYQAGLRAFGDITRDQLLKPPLNSSSYTQMQAPMRPVCKRRKRSARSCASANN